jgi:hypothetical protein
MTKEVEMARKKQPPGFVLFYECPFRDRFGEVAVRRMLPRSGVVDLEMAQALTRDLTPLKIPWEIRDAQSNVLIENSNYSEEVGK